MAGNGSECATFETQMRMITIMYASLSFLSFVIGLIALVLNRCYYCRHKDRQTDSMEEIFIVGLAISCIFQFSESFQWFALFDDFVGCTVLGDQTVYHDQPTSHYGLLGNTPTHLNDKTQVPTGHK